MLILNKQSNALPKNDFSQVTVWFDAVGNREISPRQPILTINGIQYSGSSSVVSDIDANFEEGAFEFFIPSDLNLTENTLWSITVQGIVNKVETDKAEEFSLR